MRRPLRRQRRSVGCFTYPYLDRFALELERWFSVHFSNHDAALHRWSTPPA